MDKCTFRAIDAAAMTIQIRLAIATTPQGATKSVVTFTYRTAQTFVRLGLRRSLILLGRVRLIVH